MTPTSQVEKLEAQRGQATARGHTARTWQGQAIALGSSFLAPASLESTRNQARVGVLLT